MLADAQRSAALRRIVGDAALNGLGRSARFAGFADSLATAFAELEAGLLEPDALDGDLAASLRRLPRGARPPRPLGPRPRCGATRSSAARRTSTPGTARPCSPTASRI